MPSGPARFVTTQWALVRAAAGEDTAAADALARLCSLYWVPVFAFVRRRGYSVADAEDLTQGFFGRILEKGGLGVADRERGRFRTFLLSACEHFLLNERDRSFALKRGGGHSPIPLDFALAEARYQKSFASDETPEHLYHRQWCLDLLAAVLATLRSEYAAEGREALFDRLRGFLTADDGAGTHAEAGAALDMTPGAVKVAVHRLRRRYRDALRARVAETVDSEEEVEAEIRDLLATLSRNPGGLSS
jgi:DNA-directed RNA polymerase specialized sigma24 family protein